MRRLPNHHIHIINDMSLVPLSTLTMSKPCIYLELPNVIMTYRLQALLASRLQRQCAHRQERDQDDSARSVDGCLGIRIRSVNGNNRCQETAHTVHEARNASAGASDGCR